tara:strand:+ start:328 stop:435 length:108 start_codon:yes stop_codon:yes gene_type:complete
MSKEISENTSFTLEATKEDLQKVIDELLISKDEGE